MKTPLPWKSKHSLQKQATDCPMRSTCVVTHNPLSLSAKRRIFTMKSLIQYLYYRLAKFYKNTFGIEDSPGFLLIHSCFSWGLLVLVFAICTYTLSLETIVLWKFGFTLNNNLIIITALPFALFYIFAERFIGDLKLRYKELERKYLNEKLSWLKGILVALFVVFSLVSFIMALHYCRWIERSWKS